ncbi:TonB-dependent receptor [Novosphingobium sp. BL-8A]|uniref:TonB-dependent receptor n=1 Tax=Novosphingobium sp. BL-8A TaxID=3127639 RepID=UPI0037568AD1
MMTKSICRAMLLAGTALGFAAPALAQENADEIVVTARRVEERLQDVPISITVYNQDQLSNRNVVSGADLATYTPSLSSNARYGGETATFAIRGFTQESYTSPSVGVYFADVVGPRAQGGTPGGNGAGVGMFFDLQNVQVLKGPQGTLFGRNTTGGAVLLVPQRPKDDFGGYVEGSIGNFDMRRFQAVVNVPLAETFKVRLGLDRQVRDGYLHNRSGIGPDDFGDVNYWAFRGSVLAEITPDLENYTIASYTRSRTNGTTGKIVVANAPGCRDDVPARFAAPTPGSTASYLAPMVCAGTLARAKAQDYGYWDVESGHPNPFLKIDSLSLINTTTWQASDTITLKNIASYQEFTQSQAFNVGADNLTYQGLPVTWVGVTPARSLHNIDQWTFTDEFQLQGRTPDNKLTYQGGVYYERSGPLSNWQGTVSQITTVLSPAQTGLPIPVFTTSSCSDIANYVCTNLNSLGAKAIPSILQNSLTRYWYRNIGLYAQATYKIVEALSLTGGIRYTIDKVRGEGGTRTVRVSNDTPSFFCAAYPTRPAPTGDDCVTSLTQKSEKPTWLISLDYKVMPDAMVYAKYARGYRQGNVNVSNTVPVGWGPEKVDAYEIGAKASFHGKVSGYLNLAGFYNDFSDQQLSANLIPDGTVAGASPSQVIVNAGKSRIQGIEAEGAVNWMGFNLTGGYTWLDTKLKSYSPPSIPGYLPPSTGAAVGGVLPLSPKHRITLTGTYTLPLDDSIGKISLSATYTYTAKQLAANDSPIGWLPSTNLWNLNANWNSIAGSPVDLSGFVSNLTNEKYPVFVGNAWNSTGYDSLILGQPRMYGVRLRVRFGGDAL